jgi:Fe-S-cluster containining protein
MKRKSFKNISSVESVVINMPNKNEILKPLTNLRTDQIYKIHLGSDPDEDDHISMDIMLATESGALATYEETILLDDEAPQYLMESAKKFWNDCVKAVRERVVEKTRTCEQCLGCCCYEFSDVAVTKRDLERFDAADIKIDSMVELWENENIKGHVGIMAKIPFTHPISGEKLEACPAFTGESCSIYSSRPDACRDFPMVGCEHFKPVDAE